MSVFKHFFPYNFLGARSCYPKLTQPLDLFRLSWIKIQAVGKSQKRNQLFHYFKKCCLKGYGDRSFAVSGHFLSRYIGYFDDFKCGVNPAFVLRLGTSSINMCDF